MLANPIGLLFSPRGTWNNVAQRNPDSIISALVYPLIFAALPSIAWYYGTTQVGWKIGDGDAIRLTEHSALPIVVLFYLAMVIAILGIGYMIHWMSQTYGANSTPAKGIAIAGITATPLFLAGAVGFYPLFLLDLVIGMIAIGHAVYLLYTGIPIVMKVPEERGFLFSSAVIAVALVALIAIMGLTVILWDMGATPAFTD
jgi:hypothetical protein